MNHTNRSNRVEFVLTEAIETTFWYRYSCEPVGKQLDCEIYALMAGICKTTGWKVRQGLVVILNTKSIQ